MPEIPIPFFHIWPFIEKKKDPYRTILVHVLNGLQSSSDYYDVDPEEIYKQLKQDGKLKIEGTDKVIKPRTVTRTLYALIYGKELESEVDYRVTTRRSGGKGMKFYKTPNTISAFTSLI
jgi:hypothetical protein